MSINLRQIGSRRITIGTSAPLFTFSAISDIHLHDNNDDAGYDDLVTLFSKLGNRIQDKRLNLKYIFCAGDIGMNGYSDSQGSTHEIQTFSQIVRQKCPISRTNVFSCNGNHDQ